MYHINVIRLPTKQIHVAGTKGLFNNYVTLSCLYANFHWLIPDVQLSLQPLSVNVLHQLTDNTRSVQFLYEMIQ